MSANRLLVSKTLQKPASWRLYQIEIGEGYDET
jgi:hypothetical protein